MSKTKLKRISVFGCCGSGKSYVASKIGEKLNLPVVHFDVYTFDKKGQQLPKEEKCKLILEQMGDDWVTDGNHSKDDEITRRRMTESDLLVLLDLPADVCIESIKSRHGTPRKDFPFDESIVDANNGGLEWLINYVKEYNDLGRVKKLIEQIDNFGVRSKLVHLKSRKEVDKFIDEL